MLAYKAIEFVKRDLRIQASYKFAFMLELFSSIFPIISFYFVSKLIRKDGAESLGQYGGDYFPFVMVGVALTQYFLIALRTFADTLRRSQMTGCLEAILSTRTSPRIVILCSSLYGFFMKTFHIILVFVLGSVLLGVSLGKANFLSAILLLLATIATFSSLGIFSASLILILKRGDPIEWIFGSLCVLFGGAFFPIEVMPDWMQRIASLLPITYALDGMRLAVLQGHTISMLSTQFVVLSGMAVVLLPLSVWSFTRAVEKSRRDGSLLHY